MSACRYGDRRRQQHLMLTTSPHTGSLVRRSYDLQSFVFTKSICRPPVNSRSPGETCLVCTIPGLTRSVGRRYRVRALVNAIASWRELVENLSTSEIFSASRALQRHLMPADNTHSLPYSVVSLIYIFSSDVLRWMLMFNNVCSRPR